MAGQISALALGVRGDSMSLYLRSVLLLRAGFCLCCVLVLIRLVPSAAAQGLASGDLSRLRSVGSAELSPDGRRIAYSMVMRDRPGRLYGQLWIMDLATQKSVRVGSEKDSSGGPLWSPDDKWFAFEGHQGEKGGLFVARPDGSEVTVLASPSGTNSPLPGAGKDFTWSPDGKHIVFRGTRRGLTDRETTMEDTHVWVMNADGSDRREIGAVLDKRQGAPRWAPDGSAVYFTIQERGSIHLVRLPILGGKPEYVVKDTGGVSGWSVGKDGSLAYGFASPQDAAELYLKTGSAAPRKLTDLNAELFVGKKIAEVESFTFVSNDNKFEVEAFLTKPLGMTATSKHPLIVNIHGGPHGQNGPVFNFKNQVYAAHGWATLNVNYRGSTG